MRLIMALALSLVLAGPADARVQLKRASPSNEAHTMFRYPPEVRLEFSEPIEQRPGIIIRDFDNRLIMNGPPIVEDDIEIVQAVKTPNPPFPFQGGQYTVEWTVVSKATGEVVSDHYHFHIMHHD